MGKKVYFDFNNTFVVETDNGKITGKSESVEIEGTFIIAADDVKKIMLLTGDKQLFRCSYEKLQVTHDAITDDITHYNESVSYFSSIEKYLDDLNYLKEERYQSKKKYDNLLQKVKKHNKKWYNIKIEIDE